MNVPKHSTGEPMPAITRRTAILGALASTTALAVPAVAAIAPVSIGDDALTHQLIGAFVSLPYAKRLDALRMMREQGMGNMADALAATIPPPRPATLEGLAYQFADDARAIDPTIKAVWIGNDQIGAHRGEIYNITLDRRTQKRRGAK